MGVNPCQTIKSMPVPAKLYRKFMMPAALCGKPEQLAYVSDASLSCIHLKNRTFVYTIPILIVLSFVHVEQMRNGMLQQGRMVH